MGEAYFWNESSNFFSSMKWKQQLRENWRGGWQTWEWVAVRQNQVLFFNFLKQHFQKKEIPPKHIFVWQGDFQVAWGEQQMSTNNEPGMADLNQKKKKIVQ